ncbi:putative E3 ubiquitin-protein ligase ARI9 [Golovinomyces cichoracearum]|uniref:RBR-type E3 ubiquitin transferase n=1 Tax=Golovinomyces cichoracearum TaxID=62708 RepID=A0A420HDA2_9PEZI|nr:putative E3 ubiquitin-protein ligase ARI9 [Golovinomyces cichoracearum]
MDFENSLDDASAALVYELQLQEMAELTEANLGQNEDGQLNDSQIASNAYRRDIELNYSILTARLMTNNNSRTDFINDNEDALEAEEDQSTHTTSQPSNRDEENPEEEQEQEVNEIAIVALPHDSSRINSKQGTTGNPSGNINNQSESSIQAVTEKSVETVIGECIACNEEFSSQELARVSCSHEYCRGCLSDLIQISLRDDGFYPPNCCKQPILLANFQMFLSPELVRLFDEKRIELESQDRTYCSNQACSVFIQTGGIESDRAVCAQCGTLTCVTCKATFHDGDCPADIALHNVLELAKRQGWQRCFNCRRVIELEMGCNHMTCPCGTEFCYVCAERWKTCGCPQWDEDLLLARANDGQNHVELIAAEPEPPIDIAMVNPLRDNCDHEEWRWMRGTFHCQECFGLLRNYIFECSHCTMRACNRCRRGMR